MYSNESYLIELLTQAGYLNEDILQYARSQKSPTQDLVDFLIQANYLTEDVIAQVAASNSLLPVVDLGSMHIPQEVRELITPELARRFRAIPISDDGFSINIAIDDPLNLETMDSLPQLMGRDVIFSVATRSALVVPGVPKGTPAVTTTSSPEPAKPSVWAARRAVFG